MAAKTRDDWVLALLLSIPSIGANLWAVWELLTPPPDCGFCPLPPIGIFAVAVSASLAVLGAFGMVEFARRGSIKWLVRTILATLAWWALVFVVAIGGGGLAF
jgi:hypothetical protein